MWKRTSFLVFMFLGIVSASAAVFEGGTLVPPDTQSRMSECASSFANDNRIEACTWLLEFGKLRRNDRAVAFYNRATAYSENRDFEQAISDYSNAIRINPVFAEAYNNRALVYLEMGKLDAAIEDCHVAIRIKPTDADAFYNLGNIYRRKNAFLSAIESYSKAVALRPGHIFSFHNRGIAYQAIGELDLAINDFDYVISLDPSDIDAFYNRASALEDAGQLEEAVADFSTVIRLNPSDADAIKRRSKLYVKLGAFAQALADCDLVIHINPKDIEALHRKAWIFATSPLVNVRNADEALRFAQEALDILANPENLATLAAAHAEAGNYSDAANIQARAIAILRESGETDKIPHYQDRLSLFQQNRPLRFQHHRP